MHRQPLLELARTAHAAMAVRRYVWAVAGAASAPARVHTTDGRVAWPDAPAKRAMDVFVALALLPVALPLLLVCAAAVRIAMPGPVFVSEVRTGMSGRRFTTWRLRTSSMREDEVPRIGRLLRDTHLHALPELFSVLLGDMSLVGPRPAWFAPDALPLWHTGRFEARPGLTGLAQIARGRSLHPDDVVRLDIAYVRTRSLGLDVHILARSVAIAAGAGGERIRHAAEQTLARVSSYVPSLPRSLPFPGVLPLTRPRVPWLAARGLIVADVAAAGLALSLAYGLRFGLQLGGEPVATPPIQEYAKLFVVIGAAIAVVGWLQQLYRIAPPYTRLEETAAVARVVTLGTAFALMLTFFYRDFHFSRLAMAYFWVIAIVLSASSHAAVRRWLVDRYARGRYLSRTIVVGAPGAHLLERLRGESAFGLDLIGRIGPDGESGGVEDEATATRAGVLLRSATLGRARASVQPPRLGDVDDAEPVLALCRPERVIIVEHGLTHAQLLGTIDACERLGIHVQLIPPIYDLLIDATDLTFMNGVPALRVDEVRTSLTRRAAKRALDLAVSLVLLVLLAPLLLGIALVIRRTSPGPALFRQTRGGRNGRPFEMLKFRTMVSDAEARLTTMVDLERLDQPVFKLVDDPRITPVGRWLRRFSLDELPQLLNVARGEMTLVGPRPEELRLVQKYDVWQRRRLKVKPGLTGLQQVVARGSLADLTERVQLDVYYTRKQSMLLDLVILMRTVEAVLSGRGAT